MYSSEQLSLPSQCTNGAAVSNEHLITVNSVTFDNAVQPRDESTFYMTSSDIARTCIRYISLRQGDYNSAISISALYIF